MKRYLNFVRSATAAKVIKHFADDFGLVYFGQVDQHEDEHQLVRGATVSSKHKDRHYCVGTIQDYDVIIVERTDRLTFPNKPDKSYTWLIMQFDLHAQASEKRHMFLDAHHHDETFYAHLFTKFNKLHKVSSDVIRQQDSLFAGSFNVYTPPDEEWMVRAVLTPEISSTLAHHFKHLDFEITNDHLFVYVSNGVITRTLLDHMTRAGLWLAKHIDGQSQPSSEASE